MATSKEVFEELYKEANKVAGRPITTTQTVDGKYIVEWFSFSAPPPPKGDTMEDALQGFIDYMKKRPKIPDDPIPEVENDD